MGSSRIWNSNVGWGQQCKHSFTRWHLLVIKNLYGKPVHRKPVQPKPVHRMVLPRVGLPSMGQGKATATFGMYTVGGPREFRLGVHLRSCMDLGTMVGVLRGWQRVLLVLGWPSRRLI